MAQNIIEFNGKRYDALTGAFLGEAAHQPTHHHTTPPHHPARHRGRSIDGVVKLPKKPPNTSTKATQAVPVIPVQPEPAPEPPKPTHAQRAHKTARHAAAHQPQRAKTLMRNAVSPPQTKIKPALKAQLPAEIAVQQPGVIAPKLSASKINPNREQRAHEIAQSGAIQKFNPSGHEPTPIERTVVPPVRARVAAPVERSKHQAIATRSHTPKPTEQDIFEAAIAHATSHEQLAPAHLTRKRRTRRRVANVLAGISAFFIIAGLVSYLNMPKIELKIASLRAGFSASIPTYQPQGFSIEDGVKTADNQISINFQSKSGSHFKLTQQPSNWNSTTLYDNIVAVTGNQHQVVESSGRTIYLYDGTNATWVNGGVWYQISGNAELSQDQVARLATSM